LATEVGHTYTHFIGQPFSKNKKNREDKEKVV
jgi:hypothetical protein